MCGYACAFELPVCNGRVPSSRHVCTREGGRAARESPCRHRVRVPLCAGWAQLFVVRIKGHAARVPRGIEMASPIAGRLAVEHAVSSAFSAHVEKGANQCTAILEEQLSRAACIAGVNFGCRDGVVWAQRCRGRFSCKEVGVSFLCGWPITGEERRCRCDGQETWSATSCLAKYIGATVSTRSPGAPQGVLTSTRIASSSTDCSTAARIAIGFFGAVRSISLVARSIRTNLLAPLRRAGGVDVFAYGLTGPDMYESSGPQLRNVPNRSVFTWLIRDSNDAACQGLHSPDAACGRATLQRYLSPCRVQVELQADIDRRYRFEERAHCDVQARVHHSGYNTRQLLNIYRERYSLREVCIASIHCTKLQAQ